MQDQPGRADDFPLWHQIEGELHIIFGEAGPIRDILLVLDVERLSPGKVGISPFIPDKMGISRAKIANRPAYRRISPSRITTVPPGVAGGAV
mgnify:CR=1 FL=1